MSSQKQRCFRGVIVMDEIQNFGTLGQHAYQIPYRCLPWEVSWMMETKNFSSRSREGCPHRSDIPEGSNERKKKKQGKLSILITWSTIRSTSQRSEAKFTPLPEAINSYLCSKTQCGHNKFLPWLQSIQLFRGIFNDYKMANKKSIGEKKKKEIHCNHIACGQILQNQFSYLNFF